MSDDAQAIQRITAGDGAGLEAIYDRYATLVFSLALRILRDTSEAEDVTQEVFAQVWAQAARFDASRGAVGAWLTVMTRSRSLDRVRRRRTVTASEPDPHGWDRIPDPGPSVEWMAASAEQASAAREALAALPAEQRTTLELAYYEGLTQSEIAARTGAPLGTVKTRIRSGLHRLREAMTAGAEPRRQA